MTTALEIIDRAYSLLGYKAAGEALSADDANYALDALNSMLDSWNTQSLFLVADVAVVGIVTGITADVGPGLAFDTPRPPRMQDGAFARLDGVDYPITWIDRATYNGIAQKTVQSSFPQYAFYDADLPTASISFYPVPAGPVEVHVMVQQQLAAFIDLATDYTLAPGYRKAIEYSLAEELAPGARQLDPQIAKTARNARRAIRRTNVVVPQIDTSAPGGRFNIYSGQ